MPTIFQFVDDANVVRLNLNDPGGFLLARGLDLGSPTLNQEWLSQTPYPGAVLASSREDITTMTVPIWMTKQASWTAMQTLMNALRVELQRDTNIIEYRPIGASASFFIDTYRSPVPSLFRGQDSPTPAIYMHDTEPMNLTIPRHPTMRGAGVHI